MDVRSDDKILERLEQDERVSAGFSPAIVKVFRRRMQMIRAAPDERDFYVLKSLHFEKYQAYPGQYSMRLNDQYRLIVEIESESQAKTVVIVGIKDYH